MELPGACDVANIEQSKRHTATSESGKLHPGLSRKQ
jgi:hypothetical protein